MPDFVNEYPGLIFLAIVFLLLLYGCSGGVSAFYRWRGIDLHEKRMQRWLFSFMATMIVIASTIAMVFSGLFVNLLGLLGLFALAYVVVMLIMGLLTGVRNTLRGK
jgi:hypothetical protein